MVLGNIPKNVKIYYILKSFLVLVNNITGLLLYNMMKNDKWLHFSLKKKMYLFFILGKELELF